jgi:DNA-binding XRE family transcriptional regulator
MKGKHRQPSNIAPQARRFTFKGKRVVIMEEAAYEALLRKADLWEPDLPAPDAKGNYPALAALAVIQARDILRARRKLGLSQAELARRAGVRPETLNRIEQGRNKPSVPTMAKIDRALEEAGNEGK